MKPCRKICFPSPEEAREYIDFMNERRRRFQKALTFICICPRCGNYHFTRKPQ